METTTTTTAPAAAGLALASLAAELLAQGIAAVLVPTVALALTLAGCGHELALAARRRREAMAAAAEPAAVTSPEGEPAAEPASLDGEAQTQAYDSLAGLKVRELRQLARLAGHSQLARQGRRDELLAALVPA
jgi:hypothetical protein